MIFLFFITLLAARTVSILSSIPNSSISSLGLEFRNFIIWVASLGLCSNYSLIFAMVSFALLKICSCSNIIYIKAHNSEKVKMISAQIFYLDFVKVRAVADSFMYFYNCLFSLKVICTSVRYEFSACILLSWAFSNWALSFSISMSFNDRYPIDFDICYVGLWLVEFVSVVDIVVVVDVPAPVLIWSYISYSVFSSHSSKLAYYSISCFAMCTYGADFCSTLMDDITPNRSYDQLNLNLNFIYFNKSLTSFYAALVLTMNGPTCAFNLKWSFCFLETKWVSSIFIICLIYCNEKILMGRKNGSL